MSKSLIPFLSIGLIVLIVGNKSPVSDPPINYHTAPNPNIHPYTPVGDVFAPAAQAIQPHIEQYKAGASNNRYSDSGHSETLIGDIIYQMKTEGQIQPATLNYADDILSRCAALKPPQPPICN